MRFALGAGAAPTWAEKITYAERFHVEPHRVNPPARWWRRILAYDRARSEYHARESVERHGLAKVSSTTAKIYNALMLEMMEERKRG